MSDAAKQPEAPVKKSKKGLIIILAAVLVVGVAGGGGAWWFLRARPAEAAPAEDGNAPAAEKPGSGGGGVVSLEPFLVNLADKEHARFLRVSMRLIVENAKEAEEINKDEVKRTRLRAAILELLTAQTAEPLLTQEGKNTLRADITKNSSKLLEPTHVIDVLFIDFVVQL
jgi:flagellar FliL protein